MENLKPGLTGEAIAIVTADRTALEIGSGNVPVFATPMLVALMETAAINSLAGYLPEGMTTVGTKVDISHIKATPVGMTVTARARLVEVDRKRFVFQVSAEDEAGPIGDGRHERFWVDIKKFIARAKERGETV